MSVKNVELPAQYFDKARLEADALRAEWWAYIEKNQKTLTSIPTFQEWYAQRSPS
jgi:hypothetical protein